MHYLSVTFLPGGRIFRLPTCFYVGIDDSTTEKRVLVVKTRGFRK